MQGTPKRSSHLSPSCTTNQIPSKLSQQSNAHSSHLIQLSERRENEKHVILYNERCMTTSTMPIRKLPPPCQQSTYHGLQNTILLSNTYETYRRRQEKIRRMRNYSSNDRKQNVSTETSKVQLQSTEKLSLQRE